MLFKKPKKEKQEEPRIQQETLALTSLIPLCGDGKVLEDAFIVESDELYVYADVISLQENVAQIVYQLHHAWLDEPIIESFAASGDTLEEAIQEAAKSFADTILLLYMQALRQPTTAEKIRVVTIKPQTYLVYRGKVNGVGVHTEESKEDFWDLLKEDILACLSDRKAHWIRVFTSKNKNDILCELRVDGHEIKSLSEKLLQYVENWEEQDNYHSEKQGMFLIQDTESYQANDYTMSDIKTLTNRTMAMLEQCLQREDHANIRKQLFQLCEDESLTYEIFYLIPELFCMHAYPEVEFGDKLYLICRGEETKELERSQLYSYAHIKSCVDQHFKEGQVSQVAIANVLKFSANAKAIQRALDEGSELEELMIPGIGILIPKNYKLR